MASPQDVSMVLAVETTYKTYVAGTRALEPVSEGLDWDKSVKQGKGLRVGARVARSARRAVPSAQGGGPVAVEALSKGQGLLWQGCLGAGTATLVAGTTYQHVFTLGDTPPSWSLQKGLSEVGGTQDPYSFLGVMVKDWTFEFSNDDIAELSMNLDAGDLTTAQAYVAPTPVSAPTLYHFANASLFTGTLTAPTATALASATTATVNVRGGKISVNNNLTQRLNMGGGGRKSKPTIGEREITGELMIEYDSTTYRDLVLNDGALTILVQFTGAALSTGVETLQVIIPEVKLNGELPKANGTDLIVQSIKFDGLDNLTAAQPIWVVTRTSDAAL